MFFFHNFMIESVTRTPVTSTKNIEKIVTIKERIFLFYIIVLPPNRPYTEKLRFTPPIFLKQMTFASQSNIYAKTNNVTYHNYKYL